MNVKKKIRISKFLSYILRHDPSAIKSDLDYEGYLKISLDELVKRMNQKKSFQNMNIEKTDLINIVDNDSKGRFEMSNGRIRAMYGHSVPGIHVYLSKKNLPDKLFHGTIKKNSMLIMQQGLKPMSRNLVHLTENIKDAFITGKRYGRDVVILEINVKGALKENIKFWKPGKNIYTTKYIPKKFIKEKKN